MILNLLLILAAVVTVLIVIVALRPADFRIARSTSINAPASAAFAQVNDLRRWQQISPYAKLDPTAKYTFEGPPTGTGASLSWVGNNEVGAGRMTIIDSRPDELVKMRLEFLKPFKATHTAEFTFQPEGNLTEVTWSMLGRNNFIFRAVGLFMDCEKMCGSQFEEGLANMKRIAEASRRSDALEAASANVLMHALSSR